MAQIEKSGKTWRYRIRKKEHGKVVFERAQSGFKTKREAELAAKQVELDYSKGIKLKDTNNLFVDYYSNWVYLYRMGQGSLRTDSFRKRSIKKCENLFKRIKLKDVTKDYYQKIINELSVNLSKSTVKKYHNYFKACLEHATEQQLIPYNPAKNILLKGNDKNVKKSDDKFLNYNDAIKLKNALLDDYYTPKNASRNCCLIALETGMRFSEILGLTWNRVDFKNQTIKIDRTWDYHYQTGFLPTKTKNERTISISLSLIEILQNIKKTYPNNTFVVGNSANSLMSNNAANKSLHKACKRANVKPITLHNLRHTHGSILLYKGFSILYISKRLGHASVSMTQDVYLHLLAELQEEYDNKIKESIFE